MATTTNFGWETPDDTDLVKDGAAAIRTLGSAIDTSLVDLKGGTTGQVLSKTSNTDMDFTWVTSDDANAIQNAIVDAKGDLIAASAADTPARLAVGNNGETLVADSSASTGLRWQGNYAAGRNKILNSDFRIWQRGTSFVSPAASSFTADRFNVVQNGTGTSTISQQSFTLGTAPVAGYENPFFLRHEVTSVGTSTVNGIEQRIESVRTFANETITVSFWAKSDSTRTISMRLDQFFGGGGSPSSTVIGTTYTFSATTTWTRFSQTISLPSISGKTLGTAGNDALYLKIWNANTLNSQMDIWGVQVEAGNVATAFQTATGNPASELAACQRYYYRIANGQAYSVFGAGAASSTTVIRVAIPTHVTMRVTPTSIDYANLTIWDYSGTALTTSAYALANLANNPDNPQIDVTVSGATQHRPYYLVANNNTNAYFGLSAEL